jgi:DNA (cytosine-5)-methyltransferase 1
MVNTKKTKIKYIDLCSGIGGFRIGLENIDNIETECILSADIKQEAIDTYNLNFKESNKIIDIYTLKNEDIESFDLLCAGFPCFVAGTKILTYNGYKNIEDVVLIDRLMTHTGQFQKIINLQHKIYNGSLYKIQAKYHPSFQCTEEHPFYIREKIKQWNNNLRKYEYIFKNPEWKKANELNNNHYFGMKINENSIIPEFSFDKIINQYKTDTIKIKLDNLDMWFMMGYFIGDGWIEETNKPDGRCMYKIRFAINNKDKEYVLSRINNILQITDKTCPSGNNCNKYGCADKIWFNIFKKFGKYAYGKLIPEWVQDAPKEYIQEFINGYHKADGCITKNNCYEFTSVSDNLAFGLQRLYLKLGHIFSIRKDIRSKTTEIEGRKVNQRDTYHIRGYIKETKRKYTSFIEKGYVWYAPFKIEKADVENEPVYNFEVENDNSYVIENIIGHNCQPFSSAGQKKGFSDKRGGMIFKIIDICKYHKPSYILLENVNNLKKLFEEIGYFVNYKKLNSNNFGCPQSRERVYIVCTKDKVFDFEKIKYKEKVNLESIIDYSNITSNLDPRFSKKILELHKENSIYGSKLGDKRGGENNIHSWDLGLNGKLSKDEKLLINEIMLQRRKKHWAINKNIVWMDGMPLTYEEIQTFHKSDNLKKMLDNLVNMNYLRLEKPKDLINGKREYKEDAEEGYNICKGKLSFPISKILDPNDISPTLTATDANKLAVIINENTIRNLSSKEMKKICGFPDNFIVPEHVNYADLFGNMATPPVIKEILGILFA